MANYDIIGNIAIIKFNKSTRLIDRKKFALKFLKVHKNIRTVLEKSEKFKGRLRTQKTKYLAGEKTKEALYKENNCLFRLNVDSCYFSPRLASERKEIAQHVKNGESILILFGGVAPYAIVIAKLTRVKKVISVELSRKCNEYAKLNVKLNKLQDKVDILQGDVRNKLKLIKEKFDRIVMPRPNLKDSFLEVAFPRIKNSGIISYYGFYGISEENELKELIESEAKKAKKKIKILKIKKAGEIGKNKYRYRIDFKVFN